MISAVLGSFVLVVFWTVLCFFWVYFWKSPIYCRCNAGFSFETNKNMIFLDYFWQILLVIFTETCLLAVHNTEFDRGQAESWQP
jgi:hypothetical protein